MKTEFESKYVVFSGEVQGMPIKAVPASAQVKIVSMDASAIPGCFFIDTGWCVSELEVPGMWAHNSGEVLMFLGSDKNNPEKLGATVEVQLENDVLSFTRSCAVYIPGGAAHGNIRVRGLEKPVFYCVAHPFTDTYEEFPAVATAEKGRYAQNFVDRYDTAGVQLPNVPPEVITRLFYLDSRRVPDAPYFESVWFDNTPAFLDAHVHALDEVIFFAGTDTANPGDMGGKVVFYVEGKPIELTKSGLLFLPAGTVHNPFEISGLNHPILHFSGGNDSKYR